MLLAFGWQTLAHARFLVWWIMIFVWAILPLMYALWLRWSPTLPPTWDQPNLRKTILAGLGVAALALWTRPALWLIWGDAPLGSQSVTNTTPDAVPGRPWDLA